MDLIRTYERFIYLNLTIQRYFPNLYIFDKKNEYLIKSTKEIWSFAQYF